MAAVDITPDDLTPFADIDRSKAQAMIDDALARALLVAPCIVTDDFTHAAAAKAIIRGAVLRWNDAGSGALTQRQQTAGPFGLGETIDTRTDRRGMFLVSELDDLRALCGSASTGKAFSVDTAPGGGAQHAEACSLVFGAAYCSCGADLTGAGPLYEVDG